MPAKPARSAVPAAEVPLPEKLPQPPVPPAQFLAYVGENPGVPVRKLLEPFLEYETALRAYFAQDPTNELVQGDVNLISLFDDGNDKLLKIRGRKLEEEDESEKQKYVMPLGEEDRKGDGEPALVDSMDEFKKNFNIFTEGSLVNIDWSNIIAAGSSVLTPLLRVPKKERESKKALRTYYHDKLAPASDIDLFIYGIEDPKEAIAKISSIEKTVKDNLLWETTTVRTKNTLTIVSQYPNRHVQVVLRLYKSISQVLTGFDVNCSCVAFDGTRVLANPRSVAASMAQCNDMDLTRRSPSYENRLSKYSRRGYEVYCPFLDRSRIDPTIFERSFNRTVGLARLLVLEALPDNDQREEYVFQRKREMGRPVDRNFQYRSRRMLRANKKDGAEDDIAEWNFEDVSGYQKFTIPYGQPYHARKIERLFLKKDHLLNADWNPQNKPPHRTVGLHRHPVFLGSVESVVTDCCGFCPEPLNEEEKKVQEEEDSIYVRGSVQFLKDDPGRQEIGSFYPLGPEDYTEMAYVGPTEGFCRAIVTNDLETVKASCSTEEGKTNINRRDFCGRTPLHLAVMNDNIKMEIVQTLIDTGARLIARMQDGRTALHIAAAKGRADIITALLKKSEENEYERDEREERKKVATEKPQQEGNDDKSESIHSSSTLSGRDSEYVLGEEDSDDGVVAKTATDGSFVRVNRGKEAEDSVLDDLKEEGNEDDDIYDINVIDWDYNMSPLHHAIVGGHTKVVELLVSEFGADPLLPMKVFEKDWRGKRVPKAAVLVLTLVFLVPKEIRSAMASTLLKLGAKTAQADSFSENTALEHAVFNSGLDIIEMMFEIDGPGARSVLNRVTGKGGHNYYYNNFSSTPLTLALTKSLEIAKFLLDQGANGKVTLENYIQSLEIRRQRWDTGHDDKKNFGKWVSQPIELSIIFEHTCSLISQILGAGADPSTITTSTFGSYDWNNNLTAPGKTVLDLLREKIEIYRNYLDGEGEKVEVRKILEPLPVSVLDKYPEGSYDRFCAERCFRAENARRKQANEAPLPVQQENIHIGVEKKRGEVEKLLEIFRDAEKLLLEAGAKTFGELHPEQSPPARTEVKPQDESQKEENKNELVVPFKVSVSCDESTQERYRKLFNAIWAGDLETVRVLTSGSFGETRVPGLLIAVSSGGWTTFWIAIYRGNFDMARLIMEIAGSQYEGSEDKGPKGEAMIMISQGSDDDDGIDGIDDEDEDGVYTEAVVNPSFTIEDVGAMLAVVKSKVSPESFFLTTSPPLVELLGGEEYDKLQKWGSKPLSSWNLLSYAIYKDDNELFDFALSIAKETVSGDDPVYSYIAPDSISMAHTDGAHIRLAISLGRISMLEKLMKAVGFGINILSLKQADQETENAKSKYYQGLMVNGKRMLGVSGLPHPTGDVVTKKLLEIAAFQCNLDSIKWLLTDRPWECFSEFLDGDPNSSNVKLLRRQGAKLVEIFREGLGLDCTLLPHLCLLGWRGADPMAVFRYLVSRPGALEAKSCTGFTPALYATNYHRKDALEYLLSKGADISVRDFHGRNALHLILRRDNGEDHNEPDKIEDMIKCVPENLLADMFLQRSRGSGLTPLAWYGEFEGRNSITRVPGLKLILKYSGGSELRIFNSQGNMPIHSFIRKGLVEPARIVLAYDPDLINVENASGRTAFEIAHSRFLATISDNPPSVAITFNYSPVVSRAPAEFLPEDDAPMGWDVPNEEGAYALACEAVAATKCGRILVSLAEANGLAERLQKGRGGSAMVPVMPARFGDRPVLLNDRPALPVETDALDLFRAESYHF